MSGLEERLDLIDGAIYADSFDCAVTFEELWAFSRVRLPLEGLRRRLDDPEIRTLLSERDGLFCLRGREALLERRGELCDRAQRLQKQASMVARLLRYLPFIRGILLTGSTAADCAARGDDVDLLVIVGSGRLALGFVLLGSLSRLFMRRLFCPNYYLAEDHLTIRFRNPYTAREIAQAKVLAGCGDRLLEANDWVADYLPNATVRRSPTRQSRFGRALQAGLEWPLRGRLGDRLERWARGVATARLEAHHRGRALELLATVRERLEQEIELRFHAQAPGQSFVIRYERRRAEVAAEVPEVAL